MRDTTRPATFNNSTRFAQVYADGSVYVYDRPTGETLFEGVLPGGVSLDTPGKVWDFVNRVPAAA